MVLATLQVTKTALDVNSLQQKHMTAASFEGVTAETTFEFQWVVHYEGIPSSESQYLETDMAVLSPKYGSAMDILRRWSFSDFRTGPNLSLDDPESELI